MNDSKATVAVQATAVVVMACVAAGCGGLDSVPVAEVTGRVTLDGKPVEGVILQFEPEENRSKKALPVAFGTTDADGRYRAFRTGKAKFGAAVGVNHVRITLPEGSETKIHPQYLAEKAFSEEIGPGPTVVDLELVADPAAKRREGGAKDEPAR